MRRRRQFSLGPKRKSLKVGPVKYNFKGGIPTSTSIGGKSWRMNVGRRGIRTTSRIPGTRIRVQNTYGAQPRPQTRGLDKPTQELPKKRGCLRGCFQAFALIVVLSAIAIVGLSLV